MECKLCGIGTVQRLMACDDCEIIEGSVIAIPEDKKVAEKTSKRLKDIADTLKDL